MINSIDHIPEYESEELLYIRFTFFKRTVPTKSNTEVFLRGL